MRHHLILISLDALRPDGLGCYGNPRPQVSKNLDRMAAEESIKFLNTSTPATWTLPAHMSMLSGLDPLVHGCTSSRHRYPPQTLPFPLLFEMMEKGGFKNLSITGGGYMEPPFGFGRGIENFKLIQPIEEALNTVADHAASAPLTFSFLHTYTVHDYPRVATSPKLLQYLRIRDPDYAGYFPSQEDFHPLITAMGQSVDGPEITPPDLAFIRDLYDAAVNITDSSLGAFFWQMQERRLLEDTTLIFTSDHGESLGEIHSGIRHWHHAGPPNQDQICVPLIIRPAEHLRSLLEPCTTIEERVSLLDLVPTILDLAERPFRREQFDGSSLVDLCLGQVSAFETRRLFFHACEDTSDRYLDPRLFGSALTWRNNSKVVYNPRTRAIRELYWLDDDPAEADDRINDLDQDELKRIDEVITAYEDNVAARAYQPESRIVDDPGVLDRLTALGYID